MHRTGSGPYMDVKESTLVSHIFQNYYDTSPSLLITDTPSGKTEIDLTFFKNRSLHNRQ